MGEENKDQKPGEQEAPKVPEYQPPQQQAKPSAQAAPAPKVGDEGKPKGVALGGDDDEIPEDQELVHLKPSDLKRRLSRARNEELKVRFGTADVTQIQKDLEELKTLRAARDKKKEKDMTAVQRAKAETTKERQLRLDAERSRDALQEQVVVEKQEVRIQRLAEKHVDPEYVDDLFPKFSKHLLETYSDSELEHLKDSTIEKWFKDYVEAKPAFAREHKPREDKDRRPKVRHTNGGGPNGNGPGKDGPAPKTFKPGQANSMSNREAQAEMKKQGYSY